MKGLQPLMGIDYGKARIGIAITDPLRTFAFGHKTIFLKKTTRTAAIEDIAALALEKNVAAIVVGMPNRTDGKVSELAEEVKSFAASLADLCGCPIHFEDERFTSKIAHGSLAEAGVRGRKVREIIDQRAAEIILQSYLDRTRQPE